MADVQPENGTTNIANELIRQVFMRGILSKAQLQIVFAIIDESWSWVDRKRSTPNNKVKHKTTRRPLKPKDISTKTGIHISDVCKQLQALQDAGVIRKHWDFYRFNKDYDRWNLDGLKGINDKKTKGKNPNELGEKPSELGKEPNEIGENPRKIEESQLGKNPNVTREKPYSHEGIPLMRWPAILRAARAPGDLNKVKESINKVWGLYTDDPDYLDKPTEQRWEPEELAEIHDYWQLIKFTRSSAKIAPSVIENEMNYWERFDKDVVRLAIAIHKTRYKTKKEDYTRGIMRRSQDELKRGVSLDDQQTNVGVYIPGRRNEANQVSGNVRQGTGQGSRGRITEERFNDIGIGH